MRNLKRVLATVLAITMLATCLFVTTAPAFAYSDTAGHWAEGNINTLTQGNVIGGYDDGTFRPDNYITRAEAMTIINRLTVRHTDADGLVEGFKDWPDLKSTDWYYFEVLEATNPHSYERRADNYTETWTALLENEFLIEDK